jgi:signal transduction histidine kinase
VDTTEVGRALRNLVVNAIRHTPSDGAVEVLADQQSGMAIVSVSDSCGGIPAEHLPRVFDVAFRGDTARTHGPGEGAGLGLSIARGIIEAHAGQIAVRNAGTGCQFVVQLPLAPAAAGLASAQAQLRLARGFPERGPGEAGHALAESGLRHEAELRLRARG